MTSTAPRLPVEILKGILTQAADDDHNTAHALALVSHTVCKWTEEQRWTTIVVQTWYQSVALWRTVCGVPDDVAQPYFDLAIYAATGRIPPASHTDQGDSESEDEDYVSQAAFCASSRSRDENEYTQDERSLRRRVARARFLFDKNVQKYHKNIHPVSYNVREPQQYTQHLFVDIDPAHALFGRWLDPYSYEHVSDYGEVTREYLPHEPLGPWVPRAYAAERQQRPLRIVSLGPCSTLHAVQAFHSIYDRDFVTNELTIVLDEKSDGNVPSNLLSRICQTNRLHVIGVNSKSELAGVEPPWQFLSSFVRPTPRCKRRLTHLRYDTRRFSFKPAEITAHRLKTFFQEPVPAPTPRPRHYITTYTETLNEFQHQGPRHAAPVRGAGNARNMNESRSRLVPVQVQADNDMCAPGVQSLSKAMADEWHIGALKLLHLAWAPSHDSEEEKSKRRLQDETGGWPREVRGAWTERSEKADQHEVFAAELRDAVATLYGWDAPGIVPAHKHCANLDRRQQPGCKDKSSDSRNTNTAFVPEETGMMVRACPPDELSQESLRYYSRRLQAVPAFDEYHQAFRYAAEREGTLVDPDQLFIHFGYRAPRSLLHLGGPAALRREDRLRLFMERIQGGRGAWP